MSTHQMDWRFVGGRPHAATSASALLAADETVVPDPVAETIAFFERHHLWYIVGRNPPVRSCREAAAMRFRLGKRGIPLRDELRSYLARGVDQAGKNVTVLFHCRGSQSLSFEKVERLGLGITGFSRAAVADLGDDDLGYGLINPFISEARERAIGLVRQVFDPAVLDGLGQTATMMTNAGHLTWSIEFSPKALVDILGAKNVLVASIAAEEQSAGLSARQGTIGIITGNGPESGALLWNKINNAVRRKLGNEFAGDISYPRVLVHSLPSMGWSMELDDRSELLWSQLERELTLLVNSGARTVALACNTTQYFSTRIHRLFDDTGAKFVRLSDAIRSHVEASQGEAIYAIGIGHVVDGSNWSDFAFLNRSKNIRVPDELETEKIEALAYEIKRHGPNAKSFQKLRAIVRRAPADQILLLLTELSLLFDEYPQKISRSKKIHDGLDIYAGQIVEEYFS
jgi:aspartate/glutamate racemase